MIVGSVHPASGASHKGEMVDIVHHLSDLYTWETPFGVIDFSQFRLEWLGLDLSITKPVVMMWLAGLVILAAMTLAFRGGRLMRNRFAHLLEVYILYIRDEVVYAILGEKEGRKLLPFFLTVFFFILGMNLLGLVPFGATATANVNVTGGLALVAFITIQGMGIVKNGLKGYFQHIVPPGLPIFVIPIMIPVELVGMIAKP
ncbi:MAG: F0F1 ATP synthase subunit A, partial [bacterium]